MEGLEMSFFLLHSVRCMVNGVGYTYTHICGALINKYSNYIPYVTFSLRCKCSLAVITNPSSPPSPSPNRFR
jgi:hypothetical protein